jgi:hypothetical protein
VIPALVTSTWLVRLLAFLAGAMVWGWIFGVRGKVCARAFNTTLFSPGGHETKLAGITKPDLDHVICSTEFRSAEQVYFAGDFVYSYALGHGVPGKLPLAKAVQASAAFPGGFPPAILSTKQHKFEGAPPPSAGGPPEPPNNMILTDGGVYDNMGEQWARGYADRVRRCSKLDKGLTPPNRLVVVNASARIPWDPFRRHLIPLVNEVAALLRVNNILYINTTNVRRQNIVDSFNPADPTKAAGLESVLVQISQSPYRVATKFAESETPSPARDRAKEVLEFLKQGPGEDYWSTLAIENSDVSTSLSKFGLEVTARLIYQGYVVTMCNLHVFFDGYPLFPEQLSLDEFRALIS